MVLLVAFVLAGLSGAFYFAGNAPSGAGLSTLCGYGPTFCQNPQWILYVAIAFLLWGLLLKVDRI